MRPDGKRVKDLPPIVAAIPYIMPKRYDAQNTITEYIDEELIKSYIREKRRTGVRINHMAVIIAAYYRAVMYNPKPASWWSSPCCAPSPWRAGPPSSCCPSSSR